MEKTIKKTLSTVQISLVGIWIGIRIVMSYLPAIRIGKFVEMGFGFIGAALSGALFGPWYAMFVGIATDIITALLQGYDFFWGYTLSAALSGLIYGFGLHRKEKSLKQIFIVVLIITLVVNLGFGSLWVKMMTGKAWSAFMSVRLLKNIVSLFLNTFILYYLFNHPTIKQYIKKYQF